MSLWLTIITKVKNKLKLFRQTLQNMGWRYVRFRTLFELKRKTGLLKKQFPTKVDARSFISLKEWKQLPVRYFFESREEVQVERRPNAKLERAFQHIKQGKLAYFNATIYNIGRDYDWLTNPSNNYHYDPQKHWLDIPDLSEEAGDIKYVWEKSRFSYLYTIIRYDFHFQQDQAAFVLEEIKDWIEKNPVNCGPNWRCSQEISLRILNWLFALHYYKESTELTEVRFQTILNSIYWQLHHVRTNINFSRIAVRNNHAVTETLMLYLGGLFFPFFPESKTWKEQGKAWFEEEITYQVYEDGTFLQFSHNYHRVLIQLMTIAIYLAELNGEKFADVVYERAKRSLNYLYQCLEKSNGHLPNYGANDGALFFKLNDQTYRDYRPQLNALAYFFNRQHLFEDKNIQEDAEWFSSDFTSLSNRLPFDLTQKKLNKFSKGGYYTMRDADSFTFIKCGSYKDRPSHADNLHIDIWYKGDNILQDAGTYRYNTSPELMRYFNGTAAHNTITLGKEDQMQKGPRFIWWHWSEAKMAELEERERDYRFKGIIRAFQHINKDILHKRVVIKNKSLPVWHIKDEVEHKTNLPIQQFWNVSDTFEANFDIKAVDENKQPITARRQIGYYSSQYGVKKETAVIVFATTTKVIHTTIAHR